MFEKLTKRGKVIVGLAMAYADPTGLSAAAATLDTILQVFDENAARHPDLTKLAKEMDSAFQEALSDPAFDTPKDARTLLPQMLDATAAGMDFAKAGLDANKVLAAMTAGIEGPDYRPEHIAAFERLMRPLLQKLCNDSRLKSAIDTALTREQFRRQDETNEMLRELLARTGGVQNALENPGALPLHDLQTLAARFGETAMTDKGALVDFLTLKAEEYRTYKAQIDGLDERVAAIGNLKGGAQAAAEALDFDLVEELLARVTEVEAEIFAESCEARARNALMRGQVEQAATILTAGADALAVVDPLEPARRKGTRYFEILYNHGLRYGGRGLACAVAMGEEALHSIPREEHPLDWAALQQNLGIALAVLGSRTEGKEGTDLLQRAIDAFEAALDVRNHAYYPVEWATTQQNLALSLQNLGSRMEGQAGTNLLHRAIDAYEAALDVTTRAEYPAKWATTQQNLAIALETLGSRTEGQAGTDLLHRAIAAYEAALEVRTRAEYPAKWAMTQQNVAGALQNLGRRIEGQAGADLLQRAHETFEAALDVRTRAEYPVQWAMTQVNLARLHVDWTAQDSCTGPAAHLREAQGHVAAALEVFDPMHMPYDHATATALQARIDEMLRALPGN